jgi:hypothetical protein
MDVVRGGNRHSYLVTATHRSLDYEDTTRRIQMTLDRVSKKPKSCLNILAHPNAMEETISEPFSYIFPSRSHTSWPPRLSGDAHNDRDNRRSTSADVSWEQSTKSSPFGASWSPSSTSPTPQLDVPLFAPSTIFGRESAIHESRKSPIPDIRESTIRDIRESSPIQVCVKISFRSFLMNVQDSKQNWDKLNATILPCIRGSWIREAAAKSLGLKSQPQNTNGTASYVTTSVFSSPMGISLMDLVFEVSNKYPYITTDIVLGHECSSLLEQQSATFKQVEADIFSLSDELDNMRRNRPPNDHVNIPTSPPLDCVLAFGQ